MMDKIFRKRGGRSYKFNGVIPEGWYLSLTTGEEFKTMEDYAAFIRKQAKKEKAAKTRKENATKKVEKLVDKE